MTGDGTNDAPALAQADVGVAMNTGTQAAKEAGNMVDLDSNPTKLIEIVEIGKQLLITRGSLTTFSIANDVAKYFAIIPAMFVGAFPALDRLNIMDLSSPQSAILSAVIFNALDHRRADPAGAAGREATGRVGAAAVLRRNLLDLRRSAASSRRSSASSSSTSSLTGFGSRPDAPPARHRAVLAFLVLTVLVGVLYPLAITGVAQLAFADKANGSLVRRDGRSSARRCSARRSRAPRVLPAPAVGGRRRLRRRRQLRLQPRADEPGPPRRGRRAGRRLPRG